MLTNYIGAYLFFGGLLMIIGSVGEWIIGNTFPFVVFGTFGAFWLTFAATLQPFYNAYGAYVSDPTAAAASMGEPGNPAGMKTPGFNASFAFFLVFMGTSAPFCCAKKYGRTLTKETGEYLSSKKVRLKRNEC